MYIPKYFRWQDDPEGITNFIAQFGFGLLVSQWKVKPVAVSIPMEWVERDGKNYLEGHVARGNHIWRSFAEVEHVLTIFQGPHTYISSSWYDHVNVPTWNYEAVQVYGKARIVEGVALEASLKRLVNKYEASSANPVKVEEYPRDYFEQHMRALVGFEIEVTEVLAKKKLSQNRDDKNFQEIVGKLEERDMPGDGEVAEEMKKLRPGLF